MDGMVGLVKVDALTRQAYRDYPRVTEIYFQTRPG